MALATIRRVAVLPGVLEASTMYIVRGSETSLAELVFTGDNASEVRHILNKADVAAMIAASGGGGGAATSLATPRSISATGDASWTTTFDGTANVSGVLTLANSGVAAGEYAVVTVDAKGRVTAARALTAADIPNLDAGKITTGTLTRNTTGNAGTATALQNARTINGVAFDGTANITISATDAVARIPETDKGIANGVATLDGTGRIPAAQLPSYVDDVLEFANLAALPATGEAGKIYITLDNNATLRWTGTVYVAVGAGTGTADSALILTTARNIAITGDATWNVNFNGGANVTAALTLANSGVVAGTYPKVTVDAKGRVTGGAALVAADIPALDHNTVSSAGSINLGASEW
jgi:phage-related tail fiber protein